MSGISSGSGSSHNEENPGVAGDVPPARAPSRALGSFRTTPSTDPTSSKAIGNQGKKSDVVTTPASTTRAGVPRLNFQPKVLARKKPVEEEVKKEQSSPSERGRGRGRGGDRGRGRGTSFAPVEMTASGPFALGPGEGSGRRAAPSMRIAYGASGPTAIGAAGSSSHTGLHARSLLSRANRLKAEEEDPEQYSDPDEPNMEIVDLSDVKALDWMAPDTLRRIKAADRNAKGGKMKMKKTEEPIDIMVVKAEQDYTDTRLLDSAEVDVTAEKDLANALDLSESEEEEVVEDVVEDFIPRSQPLSQTHNFEATQELSQDNRLYFFQFPSPFPTFASPPASVPSERQGGSLAVSIDAEISGSPSPATTDLEHPRKSVSFAPETKPPAPVSEILPKVEEPLDGIIGRLEIYKSGAVKMRLGQGIVLDVTAATQPSFLQHIVYLDTQTGEEGKSKKMMTVLGEVNRRFIVSPDVDVLLEQVEAAETVVTKSELDAHELLPMDVDD